MIYNLISAESNSWVLKPKQYRLIRDQVIEYGWEYFTYNDKNVMNVKLR